MVSSVAPVAVVSGPGPNEKVCFESMFNSQPDVIRLADGRVVLGRVAAVSGDDNTIITPDKQILHVKAADILPKAVH